MLSIEQSPTHIQAEAHPEFREQLQLEGIFRKKGRKDGLGIFSKLLAGLVSKKNGSGLEGLIRQDLTGESQKNKLDEKISKNNRGKESETIRAQRLLDLKNKKGQNEALTLQDQSPESLFPFVPVQTLASAELQNSENGNLPGSFDSIPVSRGSENPRNSRELPQGKVPFQNQDMPDPSLEIRNAALQFKMDKNPTRETRAEARKNERRRDRVTLDVQDLRTHTGVETVADRGLKGIEEARNSSEAELSLELRPGGERFSTETAADAETLQNGESFEQMLARELNGDLSADIVKQAAIVLKDGGEGTIKLSLKPETLGKVKIHLEMAENKISGHIVVESEEALRAFEREIHTLEQAFRDSGFENATLNAALDYRNGGQQWKEEQARPFFSQRLAASNYDSGLDLKEISGGYISGMDVSAVNLLV